MIYTLPYFSIWIYNIVIKLVIDISFIEKPIVKAIRYNINGELNKSSHI